VAARLGAAGVAPLSTEKTDRLVGLALPAIVAVLTFLTFLPTLDNGFVDWDDLSKFADNESYRGLGWTQLTWMFTASHMGHDIPLT